MLLPSWWRAKNVVRGNMLVPLNSKTLVRAVRLVLLGRLTDQPMLPATVVVGSTQGQYHRAGRGVYSMPNK
jgi:hypothetical protein